jgi:hypothetical protein
MCTRSGGRQPPVVHGNARARACDFCDGRTHMHQERGASAPVARKGVAPMSGCRPCISDLRRSSRTTPTQHPRRAHARRSCVGMRVCRRNCDFCDARTRVHQERGASAPRGSRKRTCKGAPLLRCRPCVCIRSGGRQPPWQRAETATCSGVRGTSDPHTTSRSRRADAPRSCVWANRRLLVRSRFPLHARSPNHGGLTPAALVPGESPPACGLRFPLPVRFLNPVPQTRYCVPQKSLFSRDRMACTRAAVFGQRLKRRPEH